jgi:hypothetical protein
MITKKQFVKLAEAFISQVEYEDELSDTVQAVAKKYRRGIDFLGLPSDSEVLLDAVLNILGDDFSYYHFDCNKSFEQFNKNITMADGSHPNVHSLEDLYDFAVKEGSIE